MQGVEILLTLLLVIAIVIGLQAVGVVLMSAMVVAPAASARQWTNRLGLMVVLSALFGAVAGVSGTLISSLGAGLSTGPVIVLCVSLIVALSLLFAPNRGLLWSWIQRHRRRRQVRSDQVLENLYWMASQHSDPSHAHSAEALRVMGTRHQDLAASLQNLADKGLVRHTEDGLWALTDQGFSRARQITTQRTSGEPHDEVPPLQDERARS